MSFGVPGIVITNLLNQIIKYGIIYVLVIAAFVALIAIRMSSPFPILTFRHTDVCLVQLASSTPK